MMSLFNAMTSQPDYIKSNFGRLAENFPADVDWTRQDPTEDNVVFDDPVHFVPTQELEKKLIEMRRKVKRPK